MAIGRKVERVLDDSLAGSFLASAIRMDLPFGQYYWSVPKGPLGKSTIEHKLEMLHSSLSGGVFLRIEPNVDPRLVQVKDVQPATTVLVDLTKDEETLLSEMKPKTRYNIRLAEKKGVTSEVVGIDRFPDFIRLMEQTTVRDQFRAHPSAYYKALLQHLEQGDVHAFLAAAFYEGRVVATNIMIDFAGTRTYLHGATSNLHRNVMAQYALHWFLMTDAKKKGMETFDFWGVAPEGAGPEHPWYGITRYKKGYGGEEVQMPGTFDLPSKHVWYSLYKTIRKMRSK